MTDSKEPKSHWDALVEDLGAQTQPTAERPVMISAASVPPALPRPAATRKPTAESAAPKQSDWGALAASFGIAAPPQPVVAAPPVVTEPRPASRSSAPASDVATSSVPTEPSQQDQAGRQNQEGRQGQQARQSQQAASGQAGRSRDEHEGRDRNRRRGRRSDRDRGQRPNRDQAAGQSADAPRTQQAGDHAARRFATDSELPTGALESIEAEMLDIEFIEPGDSFAEAGTSEAGDQPAERSRRRRRRRRGGRRREGGEGSREATAAEDGDSSGAADLADEGVDDNLDVAGSDVAGQGSGAVQGADAESSGTADESGRRRRRRGGRRRRRGEKSSADKSSTAKSSDAAEDEDDDSDLNNLSASYYSDHDDADDDADKEGDGQLLHRGIPTWEDAIGMIVNTNLESRAKNPQAPSHRGGRDGGHRGGRSSRPRNR